MSARVTKRSSRIGLGVGVVPGQGRVARGHCIDPRSVCRFSGSCRELGAANGDNMDDGSAAALLELADRAFVCNSFEDSGKLWGGSGCSCPTVASLAENRHHPDFYMVVLEMMILEYHSFLW